MAYRLITGATGLLGSYLLRDLLLRDEAIAVLVRPARLETVEQRVDSLLAYWEETWKRNLPRPVVLQGDIREPLLGLDTSDRNWLARHADRILHSAASLTFHEADGEPWASNVQGVQNVLDLCQDTGVRLLEHISTAYVCGLRRGLTLESELDTGQEFGNDYEKSKVQAEKLVRSNGHLDAYTIFRPSIIVGDSQTGYTTTFHGFYTPLRVAAALMMSVGLDQALDVDYLQLLGLTGDERKNFVPVDWVSDALTTIATREEPRKQTYALVSEHPVTVGRLSRVFQETVHRYREAIERQEEARVAQGSPSSSPANNPGGLDLFRENYVKQFSVYRSYWSDDPDFDCSNTRSVLPHQPCPDVTDEKLTVLCGYALESNFGFPPRRYVEPEFVPRRWMNTHGEPITNGASSSTPSGAMGISVTGSGGGSWTVSTNGHNEFAYRNGVKDVSAVARTTADTFRRLVHGQISVDDALLQASLVLYGDRVATNQFRAFVDAAVTRSET